VEEQSSDPEGYYNQWYPVYERSWSKDHMHYGFWDDDIKSHEESLENTIKTVFSELEPLKGDYILDAGCGVGGSCRYLLDHYDVTVSGITYSDLLLKKAREKSINYDSNRLQYYFMDYTNTEFEDETFDRVYAIESVCYAQDKHDFIKEAFRILKPGGKLVVADGFQFKDELTIFERKILDEFLRGWELPNLALVSYFRKGLEKYGFELIKFTDKTQQARKSSLKMYKNSRLMAFLSNIGSKLRLVDRSYYHHIMSIVRQKECIERGVWGYGMFSAIKP